ARAPLHAQSSFLPGLPSLFLPQSSTFSRLYLPRTSLRSSCASPCVRPCPPSPHVTPCLLPLSPSFRPSSHCRIPVPHSPFFLFRRPIHFTSTPAARALARPSLAFLHGPNTAHPYSRPRRAPSFSIPSLAPPCPPAPIRTVRRRPALLPSAALTRPSSALLFSSHYTHLRCSFLFYPSCSLASFHSFPPSPSPSSPLSSAFASLLFLFLLFPVVSLPHVAPLTAL
ncbi:hypothetical protein C8J57DRAFT_1711823, partial [Mycena rebaudengoi]